MTKNRRPLKFFILSFLAVAALTFAGCEFSCGTSNAVSANELETQLSAAYQKETGSPFDSISCQDAKTTAGSPINCTATVRGVDLKVTGKVEKYNADTNKADFSWTVKPAR